MDKFSTASEYKKIVSRSYSKRIIFKYSKIPELHIAAQKTKISLFIRTWDKSTNKYQSVTLGDVQAKSLPEVLELYDQYKSKPHTIHNDKTLSDFFHQDYVPRHHSRKRSIDADIKIMQNHTASILGDKRLSEISRADINTYITALGTKNLSEATQLRYIHALSSIMSYAVDCDILETNPVRAIKNKPSGGKQVQTVPSYEKLTSLLDLAFDYHDKQVGLLTAAAILTGARQGELRNAKWTDINFSTSTWRFPITKSNKSREIIIPQRLAEALKAHEISSQNKTYVFQSDKTGKPISKPHRQWKKLAKQVGLGHLRFHDLRHSYATIGMEKFNMTIIELKNHLGHSSIKVTERYLTASSTSMKEKINTMYA